MAIVTTTEMFKKAYDGGYAIGAFNVNNMEIIQGITEAAMEEKAPLILQVSSGARKYAKHVYLMKLIEAALLDAQDSGVDLPICVHLDHGDTFELCKSCIDGGFTSVMIDGSHFSFEENIKLTKQVVEYAHDHGVVVEGELGRLAGIEDGGNYFLMMFKPEELAPLTSQQLRLLRNSIYARHGRYFKSEDLQRYFSQFDWYQPYREEIGQNDLSPTELHNVELIRSYE